MYIYIYTNVKNQKKQNATDSCKMSQRTILTSTVYHNISHIIILYISILYLLFLTAYISSQIDKNDLFWPLQATANCVASWNAAVTLPRSTPKDRTSKSFLPLNLGWPGRLFLGGYFLFYSFLLIFDFKMFPDFLKCSVLTSQVKTLGFTLTAFGIMFPSDLGLATSPNPALIRVLDGSF